MSVSQPVSRKIRKVSNRRLLTVVPFVVVAVGAAFVGAMARTPAGHIAPGVQVKGLSLGGQDEKEARLALQQWATKMQATPITLRFASETGFKRVWKPEARKLGLGVDVQATYEEVAKAGQNGVLGQVSHLFTGSKPISVPAHATLDEKLLRAYLKKVAHASNRLPKNARLLILKGGKFSTRPEKLGLALDIDASLTAITQAWQEFLSGSKAENASEVKPSEGQAEPAKKDTEPEKGDKSEKKEGTEVTPKASDTPPPTSSLSTPEATLATKVTQPAVTTATLKEIDGVIGSHSTRFGGTGRSRGSNIALAASRINGTVLAPGEVFSYNKVVGPRVASAGFREAPVIIKGELVPGIGGGICQVSSTLYNAVLKSDLKIVHRAHHAFPVHYLPAGRDATVVDGSIDFKFQNSTQTPLYIVASSGGGRLAFTLYGKRVPGREVSIELANHTTMPAGTETRRDPSLPMGRRIIKDRGHTGHKVNVYRVVKENGQVVKRELIAHDHYRPFPTIVLVGTRPVFKPKPKVKPNPTTTTPTLPGVPPNSPAVPPAKSPVVPPPH